MNLRSLFKSMPGLFSRTSRARSAPPQPPVAQPAFITKAASTTRATPTTRAASITRADLSQYHTPFSSADEVINQHSTRLPGPSPFRISPSGRVEHRKNLKPNFNVHIRCNVHPFLTLSNPPALRYKLTDPPSHTSITRSHSSIPPQLLSQPATNPPLPFLTLVFPRLPWQCPVHASSNGSYITLFDVLDTLYRFLRANISEREYQSLPADSQRRVYEAYQHRCSRLRSSRERYTERMKGVKRVDFLMGEVRFQGLGLAGGAANVWMVNLA